MRSSRSLLVRGIAWARIWREFVDNRMMRVKIADHLSRYHEMRLILTKTLYNFDLTLCEESKRWADQKTYIMWEKKPLMVRLTPRKA